MSNAAENLNACRIAEPVDHWSDAVNEVTDMVRSGTAGELETVSYDVLTDCNDSYRLTVDAERQLITIEATLTPWRAMKVMEFLKHLPEDPRGLEDSIRKEETDHSHNQT